MARDILHLLIALAGIAVLIDAAVTGDPDLPSAVVALAAAAVALEWSRK